VLISDFLFEQLQGNYGKTCPVWQTPAGRVVVQAGTDPASV
jgi:hypothetical protein